MRKTVTYQWHLAELMARAGMHNSTDLLPHLKERGIDLSPSQIYRLVTGRPEPVSLQFLATVCDIFGYLHLEHTHEEGGIGRQRCRPRQDRPAYASTDHP